MKFSLSKRLFEIFPELKVVAIVAEGDFKKPYRDPFDLLKSISEDLGKLNEKPQNLPRIKVWRDAFRKVGITPSKFYSSVEALLRRVLKGGIPGPINPLVDLCNAFSLKNLVPVGTHDLDKIVGDIEVTFASGGEEFIDFSGEVEKVPEGEVVYKDDKGILTRRWVWRQTKRDMVTDDTKRVFIPIDILHQELSPSELGAQMVELLEGYFPGVKVKMGVVDLKNNTFKF